LRKALFSGLFDEFQSDLMTQAIDRAGTAFDKLSFGLLWRMLKGCGNSWELVDLVLEWWNKQKSE
jgi:hypothetical protein